MKKTISIVTPIYNEEESLSELCQRLIQVSAEDLHQYDVEIIAVNDGSTDRTTTALNAIVQTHKQIQAIHLSNNFGKSAALAAGLRRARGDIIVTLDGDLQDRPENIPQLITLLERGNDLVVGWKKIRQDPLEKRVLSKLFNTCVRLTWDLPLHDVNCGLKAMTRPAANAIQHITGDSHRFIPVLIKKNGFVNITETPITHDRRKYGTSKYGWKRIIDGFTGYVSLLLMKNATKQTQTTLTLFGIYAVGATILLALS